MSISSILNKFWGKRKKEGGGRISSVECYEQSVERPLQFMTSMGGLKPLGFQMNTDKADAMRNEPLELLRQAIEAGCIDEYSELTLFYDMVDQYSTIRENELKAQAISRRGVGHNIVILAQEQSLIRERKQIQLLEERSELSGVKHYQEFEKGKGV